MLLDKSGVGFWPSHVMWLRGMALEGLADLAFYVSIGEASFLEGQQVAELSPCKSNMATLSQVQRPSTTAC